jgi:hypothetical protein
MSGLYSDDILKITQSHPYYTQQLAFNLWEILKNEKHADSPVAQAVAEIVQHHDIDYERLWNMLNRSDMRVLIGMAFSDDSPLSEKFTREYFSVAGSTVFSVVKRLTRQGLIVKNDGGYEIDDPFLMQWIREKRLK